MESYRSMIERQMIVGTVQRQEIMQKATLTDEEARQYYDAHQKEFMTPATVTLREILVTVPTETRDGQDVFNVGRRRRGQEEDGRRDCASADEGRGLRDRGRRSVRLADPRRTAA